MQYVTHGLDLFTQQLIKEEWQRIPRARGGRGDQRDPGKPAKGDAQLMNELSPVIAVLPGLIRLVHECTDRPVNKFRPTIKRLILEQLFMDLGGDAIVDAQHLMLVKRYVDLTVRVLVRVRQHGLGKDEWSNMPVTPQMFG